MRISDWSSDVCSSDLNREWVVARRARTKHLIELGGLVAKARLVELADDDRALLYGAFLDPAQQFHSADGDALKLRLKRRGTRAFADESSDDRRVGKEWVSTCKSRWAPYPEKKKKTKT